MPPGLYDVSVKTIRSTVPADSRALLPSADAVLSHPLVRPLRDALSQDFLLRLLHDAKARCPLPQSRQQALEWVAEDIAHAAAPLLLRPRAIINATGIIIHTGLGTAPLGPRARTRVLDALGATPTGAREFGGRHEQAERLLAALTGAQAACITCQTAASLTLATAALAPGAEIVCAARDLLEISHGIRIADLLRAGGAQVAAVGAANAVHLRDYADALSPRSAAIVRVWHSNYASTGYVAHVETPELARLARERGVLLLLNLGAGSLVDLRARGLPYSPTLQDALSWGADLVFASADKLIGGPQAGIIIGRNDLVSRLLAHPLYRAVRPAKLDLAALEGTLAAYLAGRAWEEIPVLRLLAMALDHLEHRARALAEAVSQPPLRATAHPDTAACGGAALPDVELPTWTVRIRHDAMQPDRLAQELRQRGVAPRVAHDAVVLDLRSVLPEDDERLAQAVRSLSLCET
jgi:L-seryl-tRNA(Ser) seleniumtransferase